MMDITNPEAVKKSALDQAYLDGSRRAYADHEYNKASMTDHNPYRYATCYTDQQCYQAFRRGYESRWN